MFMDEELLEDKKRFESSYVGSFFELIKSGIWHTTNIIGILGILDKGYIIPNKGQFPYTYPQTKNSFGFFKGYVSLFDFEFLPIEKCYDCYYKWTSFFTKHKPITIAINIDRNAIAKELISNESAGKEVGFTKVWIPYVEVWHKGPIPITSSNGCFLIPESELKPPVWIGKEDTLNLTYKKLMGVFDR